MAENPRPESGPGLAQRLREHRGGPIRLTITPRKTPSRALSSPLVIIYVIAGIVVAGTLLLLLPFTHHGGGITPIMVALFTATSAVTDTGLVVRDTSTYWTRFGQVVILGLIYVGGLGFMSLATFLLALIGQRITLAQRLMVKESLGADRLGGLVHLSVAIVLASTAIQVAGAVLLFLRFMFLYPPAEAAWQAVFHSVSAFNNAGFLVLPEAQGLTAFRGDGSVMGIMGVLIFLGGLGYPVIADALRCRARWSLFTLNSKLVLSVSIVLLVGGMLVFFSSEYANPRTIGPLPLDTKLLVSVFQSVSARTAGFQTENLNETMQHTNFFFITLMFIGAASASTGGGIRVNTVGVVAISILSTIRGKRYATSFGREIPQEQVQRAMTIGAVATVFIFALAFMLTFSETRFAFIDLLFECVSAFGTVGFSTGLTPELSVWGHLILILTMFVGKVGPLTIALAMAQRGEGDLYRYAQERVTIG